MKLYGPLRFSAVVSHGCARIRACFVILGVLICGTFLCNIAAAKTVRLSRTVFTLGVDQTQTLWPNARVSLKDLSSGREASIVSDGRKIAANRQTYPRDCHE